MERSCRGGGEPEGLGSNPSSANNWMGCRPSLTLSIFLFEMRPHLWSSHVVFSAAEPIFQMQFYLEHLHLPLDQIEALVGRELDPRHLASLTTLKVAGRSPSAPDSPA